MKKVTLVAVGKLKENFFAAAADEYIKRLSKFCDLKIIQLSDFATSDAVKKESSLISDAAGKNYFLLDIGGENLSSEEFSRVLDREFMSGAVTFVIGGSGGVDAKVRQGAAKRISFGAFTYPHQLMRVMFLEQLYRAFTISEGLPYHK